MDIAKRKKEGFKLRNDQETELVNRSNEDDGSGVTSR